jgi:predicted ATP-grasp superfamily ATP-dependent carboligase
MRTLILTCAGGGMMPWLLAALRRDGGWKAIVGLDADATALARRAEKFDAVFSIPLGTAPDFPAHVAAIAMRFRPTLLVPGSDEEAHALGAMRAELAATGIAVNALSPTISDRFADKGLLPATLAAAGIAHPRAISVDGLGALRAAARELGHPEKRLVLKPRRGRGRRGVVFVGTRTIEKGGDIPPELPIEAVPEELTREAVLCSFVEGKAASMDVLARDGRLVQHVARQWLAPWRYPFPGMRLLADPVWAAVAARIAECAGLDGLFDVDFIVPREGPPQLIEINPRPSGSCVVALAAGIPLFAQLGRLCDGETVSPVAYADGRVVTAADLDRIAAEESRPG